MMSSFQAEWLACGMPLVAWSVLAYAAALIVCLSGGAPVRAVLGAVALAGTLGLTLLGRRTPALLCAIAAGAVLTAAATLAHDARCVAALAAATQWEAEFESDAHVGDVAHVTLRAGDCSSTGTLLVAGGDAAGGTTGRVRGRATADARGVFIEQAVIDDTSRGSILRAARQAAGRRIDRIFHDDAPMARALVIADLSGLTREQRDRYATAGVIHLLNVSGLHLAVVAMGLGLLASVLRLPVLPARVATLALLAAYVAAIGAPARAVRSVVMLGAIRGSRVLQRPTSPWAILAVGAGAPLIDPHTVLSVGWQFSVIGTAALIAGRALSRRIVPKKWRGWRRVLAVGGIIGCVATAVTAPLVAWVFGRVPLLGPITGLVAGPIIGLLQPLLFIALALPIPAVADFAADASHALLLAFDGIARAAASVPHAAPAVLPSEIGAVSASVASVALIVACQSPRPARAAIVGALGIATLVIEPLVPRPDGMPELHMIDVGQGDALALRTTKGRWIVVDAGRSWEGGDAGRSTVVPYLSRRGGAVEVFVLSHPHADHVGGAASLFALLRPHRFLDPGYVGTTGPYRAALAEARADGIPWQRVHPGDSLIVDDITLTALAPDSAWAARLSDANLASTVLIARMGSHRVLFTGDAEAPEEEWLLEHAPDALYADVLKVAHHGSATSTTARFLAAVHPRLALVSVGAHNMYGHPDAEVMDALAAAGVATLRTDRLGTVVLRFLPNGIDVSVRNGEWFMPIEIVP